MNTPEIIAALRRLDGGAIPSSSRERMREAVIGEFHRVTAAAGERLPTVNVPMHSFAYRFMFVSILIAIFLTIGIGASVAANKSKPGDALYPLDRGLEKMRLDLTATAEGRAKLEAKLAEERSEELTTLEREQSPEVPSAKAETTRALRQAVTTVTAVKVKQEKKGNAKAAEALEKVETRLRVLRQQHLEDENENENESADQPAGLIEAVAKVMSKAAEVKIEFNGQESVFVVQSTSEADIVAAISQRTGLSASEIQRVLKLVPIPEPKDESETQGDDDQATDAGTNANTNVDVKSGGSDEKENEVQAQSTTSIRVEVRPDKGLAEIRVRTNGTGDEWTVMSTSQTVILADITARTGLTAGRVLALWQYAVD